MAEQANAENTVVMKVVAALLLWGVGGVLLKVPCSKLTQRFTIVTYWGLKKSSLLNVDSFFYRAELHDQNS